MNRLRQLVTRVAMWIAVAAPCSHGVAHAQQNLFNVPSSDITPQGQMFYQQQVNFGRSIQSNTTVSYGLGDEFEMGMNVFSLGLLPEDGQEDDPNAVLFLLNAQKGLKLTDSLRMSVGTQIGQTAPDGRSGVRVANFTYVPVEYKLPDDIGKLYLGGYFANNAYHGFHGDHFGFMAGYDIPVIPDRFYMIGDYLSGRNGISVGVIGGALILPGDWIFSGGAQFPGIASGNAHGGVIELTYLPGRTAKR